MMNGVNGDISNWYNTHQKDVLNQNISLYLFIFNRALKI